MKDAKQYSNSGTVTDKESSFKVGEKNHSHAPFTIMLKMKAYRNKHHIIIGIRSITPNGYAHACTKACVTLC